MANNTWEEGVTGLLSLWEKKNVNEMFVIVVEFCHGWTSACFQSLPLSSNARELASSPWTSFCVSSCVYLSQSQFRAPSTFLLAYGIQ